MKIVLFGATGPTGGHVIQQALDKGHEVTAIVRNPDKVKVVHDNLQVAKVDIFDADRLSEFLRDHDVIISCLGSEYKFFGEITLYSEATKAIVTAMRKTGVSRLVFMTSWFVDDEADHPRLARYVIKPFLRKFLVDMRRTERYLAAECPDIQYTSVRPPGLTNGKPTEREIITVADVDWSEVFEMSMTRADVARYLLGEVETNRYPARCVSIGYGKS